MKYEKNGKATRNNIQITKEKYLNKVKCVRDFFSLLYLNEMHDLNTCQWFEFQSFILKSYCQGTNIP